MTNSIRLAVVGAHLRGQPLNHQLTDLQATFVQATQTAPLYRLYALSGGTVPKPGLVRQTEGGWAIAIEVWALSAAAFGQFVAAIPSPLGIGTLVLADDSNVKGFICEPYAIATATDISHFGSWLAYRASQTV